MGSEKLSSLRIFHQKPPLLVVVVYLHAELRGIWWFFANFESQ